MLLLGEHNVLEELDKGSQRNLCLADPNIEVNSPNFKGKTEANSKSLLIYGCETSKSTETAK